MINNNNKNAVLSVGTIYLDITCVQFPIGDGFLKNKEVKGSQYTMHAGGSAFNFAQLCVQLGLPSIFIGMRGNDGIGELMEQYIQNSGVVSAVTVDPHAQSNIAIHYVDETGNSIMTSCGNANQQLNGDVVHETLSRHLSRAKFLYLGGCFKLKNLLPAYKALAQLAREQAVQVIVDHGRVNNSVTTQDMQHVRELLKFANYYLPSKDEFLATWDTSSLADGAAKATQYTDAVIVVKDSEQGAHLYGSGQFQTIPAIPTTVLNTVGAGDSFNAGFLYALETGMGHTEAIRFANAVASVKISTTSNVSMQLVKERYQEVA